ncbi:hypothetical protein LBU01_19310 [Lentilactobacillus buchneri]|nr:hypothetical protein LBU01_19310 [Lentilactobacillus buchneri]
MTTPYRQMEKESQTFNRKQSNTEAARSSLTHYDGLVVFVISPNFQKNGLFSHHFDKSFINNAISPLFMYVFQITLNV